MPKQIIIAEQHRIAAVFSEDQIQELVVATGTHQVSDVYVGTVENVIPGIDAAFVNIGDPERNGFMHVTDLGPLRLKRSSSAITELLTPKQKVLVQVMKEPTGNKGPRLTGNITLPGRYLVLMPFGKGVHLSRRIVSESQRNTLRALAILVKPAGMGLLVRTEAEGVGEDAIIEDLEVLQKQWEVILEEYNTTREPTLLNRDDDFIQRVLRDMYNTDVNRIVVDSPSGLKRVKQNIANWNDGKNLSVSIDHHTESQPILEYFRVNAAIREALKPRVDLPSGGYIIIEPTEALTVVDVNSGSFTRSATSRETVLWTNCEAAVEIARQLRLRNIAGVIVIDFIDMDSRHDKLKVLEQFNTELAADKARPQIAQLSELGLVELTRKRQGQNIYELFSEPCPSCTGLGHLAKLPGEEEVRTVEVSRSSTAETSKGQSSQSTSSPRNGDTPSPRLRDSAPRLRDRSPGTVDSASDTLSENEGETPEIDLIHHPSYQEMGDGTTRRRRRRRFTSPDIKAHAEETAKSNASRNDSAEESRRDRPTVEPANDSTPEPEVEAEVEEEKSRSRSSRESKAEDTPEVITVEMTPEEQEVYAMMGISPCVKLGKFPKNPKSATIHVVSPGEGQDNLEVRSLDKGTPEKSSSPTETAKTTSEQPSSQGTATATVTESSDTAEAAKTDSQDSSETSSSGRKGRTRRRRRRSSASSDS
ncbi:MAG: Rne/Rng family ribonuclease [Phormidium sp. GEM2.Bin31]|nr:MAG: Rne/Rng family ribonuclease [Phormidium sp. GEM2.Bin31]